MLRSLRIGHRRYVLTEGVNTIGRDPNSTVCLNDASVSRNHARILIDGERVMLEDLASKNGSAIMGNTIKEPAPLKDGDEIEFGHVKGWFIVEAGEDPPTTTHL